MSTGPTRVLRPLGRGDRRPTLLALALICLVSVGARAAWLGEPCRTPCRSAADRVLVFAEAYYVNAARVIAGVRPARGATYARAPSGVDPNAEHPQLAKLTMAGLIELLGDGPWAWRLPSLILGTLCLLGMYALVRAAGGERPMALGAAGLMAADNLLLVHGRIATLDVYVLAGMLWASVAYLRGQPLLAGALVGVAAGTKMVAPYLLLVLGLVELGGWAIWRRARAVGGGREALRRLGRLVLCAAVAAIVLIALLAVMDRVAPPYDDAAHKLVRGGPFAHLGHMFSYAAQQTSPSGPKGIASYPWDWLVDLKPITYLNIDPSHPASGLYHVQPAVHFLGVINPLILLGGLLGLGVSALGVGRALRGGRDRRDAALASLSPAGAGADLPVAGVSVPVLALAWFAGTYGPFLLLSLVWQRTSYLYYMVIVMPGLYMAAAHLAARLRTRPRLLSGWAAAVVVAAIVLYPFTPLPG